MQDRRRKRRRRNSAEQLNPPLDWYWYLTASWARPHIGTATATGGCPAPDAGWPYPGWWPFATGCATTATCGKRQGQASPQGWGGARAARTAGTAVAMTGCAMTGCAAMVVTVSCGLAPPCTGRPCGCWSARRRQSWGGAARRAGRAGRGGGGAQQLSMANGTHIRHGPKKQKSTTHATHAAPQGRASAASHAGERGKGVRVCAHPSGGARRARSSCTPHASPPSGAVQRAGRAGRRRGREARTSCA